MPLFMDIHKNVGDDTTPEAVAEAHRADLAAQAPYNVRYLRWWFNRDARSIYCLVDAPSADAAIEVHQRAHGLVPDELIPVEQGEVNDLIGPDEFGPALREDPPDRISTDNAFRTVVFTDLEGSTTMTQRLGDDAALRLIRRHDELMHACLDGHRGHRVKHTGDGLMASFTSVARAVECMIAMQRALAEHNEAAPEHPLWVRMGAAAGEPVADSQDLFGATVQLASRLCAYAQPGQIVVAGVIRDLSMGKTFSFQHHGEVELKGFAEPVRVYEVHWRN
jgi:class 3 adenylate cyclase